jgi:hypothetical protein
MNERLLSRYTDLTLGQWDDLRDAVRWKLFAMNGARRLAMQGLIDENLEATELGRMTAAKARMIEEGEYPPPAVDDEYSRVFCGLGARSAAARLRKNDGTEWCRSVHLKLLQAVYSDPQQTYKWLAMVYGYEAVHTLVENEWIEGEEAMSETFLITDYGFAVLQEAVEHG